VTGADGWLIERSDSSDAMLTVNDRCSARDPIRADSVSKPMTLGSSVENNRRLRVGVLQRAFRGDGR